MTITARQLGTHLLFWTSLAALWYLLREADYANSSVAWRVTLVKVTDLALMVYITNVFLLPGLLYGRRYFLFALAFVGMIVVSSALKMQVLSWVTGQALPSLDAANWRTRIYDHVLPHFFLVTAGAAIQLLLDHQKLQWRLAETAREKAQAELDFLKSQINPHFLFNSLNSVYFLIDRQNEEARLALHRFSEMLRYQLYETELDRVPLEKEIRFLQDYIELQRLRRSDRYQFQLEVRGEYADRLIAPLLLMPFVENAFKHLSHYDDRVNTVQILAACNVEWFELKVRNSCQRHPLKTVGGIGLQNVKRRLELQYPGQYHLRLQPDQDWFEVSLQIQLRREAGESAVQGNTAISAHFSTDPS